MPRWETGGVFYAPGRKGIAFGQDAHVHQLISLPGIVIPAIALFFVKSLWVVIPLWLLLILSLLWFVGPGHGIIYGPFLWVYALFGPRKPPHPPSESADRRD